jgi:hypothetical protein
MNKMKPRVRVDFLAQWFEARKPGYVIGGNCLVIIVAVQEDRSPCEQVF